MKSPTLEQAWEALTEVSDPEIPVVNLVEMGIIRDVIIDKWSNIKVIFTPTFSGCPAQQTMKVEIEKKLTELGFSEVIINIQLSPPWSTDWITKEARDKLKKFGLAPPPIHNGNISLTFFDIITCPYCNSTNTTQRNNWGSTPCRTIFFCNECQQPFEQFKAL